MKKSKHPTLHSFLKSSRRKRAPQDKVRTKYFSVYFGSEDVNYKSEIKILEHENTMSLTDRDMKDLGNYFPTKIEAKIARSHIISILRIKED